jgi:fascin 1/2
MNAGTRQYLTQETFGFAINCNGKSLKKKQTFTLHAMDGAVHLQTHLGKYMYGDNDGNIKGDAESPSAETQWTIVPQTDGTWALKSSFGFFFHGTGDKLSAFVGGDDVPADGKWIVHLAMHPQINLYSVMRKRYVHLGGDQLTCDEDIPWGDDALLSLMFFNDGMGRYGFMSADGRYLENSGKLVAAPNDNCKFMLGFHDDNVSFCDANGQFLQCIGGNGVLKVNKTKVTKDELFSIQDSEPQFTMVCVEKNSQVSARNGSEVKADQKTTDVQDSERFQFEIDEGIVHIMSNKVRYWAPREDGSMAVVDDKTSANTAFVINYSAGNTIQLTHKASGKTVFSKPNGGLFATGDGSEATSHFELKIINRPSLILRGQYGFLGIKGASGRVECNKSEPAIFNLQSQGGEYFLQGANGKYWTIDDGHVSCTSAVPVAFNFEFVQRSKMLIKHKESGMYLQGEQNGGFTAKGSSENINTLWEY